MELETTPKGLEKNMQEPINLTAGQQLKVELGPDNELVATVPEGKVWAGILVIQIDETDA